MTDETRHCYWANCDRQPLGDDEDCGAVHCERCACAVPEEVEVVTLIREDVRGECMAAGTRWGYPTMIVCADCADDEEREYWAL